MANSSILYGGYPLDLTSVGIPHTAPNTFYSPTYQRYVGLNGTLNNLDELTDLAKSATRASNFANWMGGIGSGIGAIASIGSLWASIDAADKQEKSADKMYTLARNQHDDEKARYNKRQQERDAANQAIAESAKFYNPFARQ